MHIADVSVCAARANPASALDLRHSRDSHTSTSPGFSFRGTLAESFRLYLLSGSLSARRRCFPMCSANKSSFCRRSAPQPWICSSAYRSARGSASPPLSCRSNPSAQFRLVASPATVPFLNVVRTVSAPAVPMKSARLLVPVRISPDVNPRPHFEMPPATVSADASLLPLRASLHYACRIYCCARRSGEPGPMRVPNSVLCCCIRRCGERSIFLHAPVLQTIDYRNRTGFHGAGDIRDMIRVWYSLLLNARTPAPNFSLVLTEDSTVS